jgi:predicted metal-dependent peptidase
MDVSGSCINYIGQFQQIAAAFDADRETFDLRVFAFDTKVTEITHKTTSIPAGGGTAFSIIEDKVLELEKEYRRYPDCVIVVTDGEGNKVSPKGPTKWIWLMIPPATKQYIPLKSKTWLISQVQF